jgi:hypothetical protein
VLALQVVEEGGGGAPQAGVGFFAGVADGLALLVGVGGEDLIDGFGALQSMTGLGWCWVLTNLPSDLTNDYKDYK